MIQGFGSPFQGKERAMAGILTLNADAIIVKEGVLCPGSYMMSKGKMKYIPVEEIINVNKIERIVSQKIPFPRVKYAFNEINDYFLSRGIENKRSSMRTRASGHRSREKKGQWLD